MKQLRNQTLLNFMAKLALCIIALAFIEGLSTLGAVYAVPFTQWHWAAYLLQSCVLVLALYVSSCDWEEK